MGSRVSGPATTTPGAKDANIIRFICISDTHNRHAEISFDGLDGDVLLHTGDWSEKGTVEETRSFIQWLAAQPFRHKVLIAGNHDIGMDDQCYDQIAACWKNEGDASPALVRVAVSEVASDSNLVYLENSSITIEGFKIFGSPMTPVIPVPRVGRMAFNLMDESEQRRNWKDMPNDTDILLTHGPPHGFHDGKHMNMGDSVLLERILEVSPKLHVFGHVHESAGSSEGGTGSSIVFVNASSQTLIGSAFHESGLDRFFPAPLNKPLVVDLPRRQG